MFNRKLQMSCDPNLKINRARKRSLCLFQKIARFRPECDKKTDWKLITKEIVESSVVKKKINQDTPFCFLRGEMKVVEISGCAITNH
jgi:hypothetical protein